MEVFPIFDQKSDQFDERLANEVMNYDAFIFQGMGCRFTAGHEII